MRHFVSDVEGPLSKNDNAYELSDHYLTQRGIDGKSFFTVLSSYDDVLAYLVKRPHYNAGDTLKLILPFLKAYGADNESVTRYCLDNVLLVPKAIETLTYIHEKLYMPQYLISTSYEQYVEAVATVIGLPFQRIFSTELNLNKFTLPEVEKQLLTSLSQEISLMKSIDLPINAENITSLPVEARQTYKRLEEIFWQELPQLSAYSLIQDTKPIGGLEKANAIVDICKETNTQISNIMYIGDSITDVEALRLVKTEGGLSVSFNGNDYAIKEAQIAILSPVTTPLALLASIFNEHGSVDTLEIAHKWNQTQSQPLLNNNFNQGLPNIPQHSQIYLLNKNNRDRIAKESSHFRKKVRGQKVGSLG